MKKCTKCGVKKHLSDFHKDCHQKDGMNPRCKSCICIAKGLHYKANSDVKCTRARDYYAANADKVKEYKRRYRQDHADEIRAYDRKRYADDPKKRKASAAAMAALDKGLITKGPCECCGTTEKVEGHHDDYDKPISVRWFCRSCHKLLHSRLNRDTKENEL